jgi:phosphoglycerate dehydrogenase-like enzyme
MNHPLTIWTNLRLGRSETEAAALLQTFMAGIQGHELVRGDDALKAAHIAFGGPPVDAMLAAPKLRWVQITSAGYTAYDRPEIWTALKSRNIAFTNGSGVFDDACAQHLLAMMLGLARRLPLCVERQRTTRPWSEGSLRAGMRVLTGESAILYGYGAIGRRLAELLAPFRMDLVGVRRRAPGDEPIAIVTPEQADAILNRFDHVINILPASDETAGFFSADRIARMKRGACFYNIGRGATVAQSALIQSLQTGHLAGAYLDVTEPEPLPPDHPLWSAPNCWITPHIGGGYHDEWTRIVRHFLQNLRRFESGESLINRVV